MRSRIARALLAALLLATTQANAQEAPPPAAPPAAPATAPMPPTAQAAPPAPIVLLPGAGDPVPPGYIVIEAGPPPAPAEPTVAPPPAEAPPPRPLARTRFSPSIDAGYGYQNMFSIPSNGFDVQAILAADNPRANLRVGGALGAAFGTTDGGLHTTTTNLGPYVEGHFDRFRLGGGLRIGTFNVTRATDGTSILNLSAGIYARGTLDIIQFDKEGKGALYLAVKASVDGVGTSLYGVNASLGARF